MKFSSTLTSLAPAELILGMSRSFLLMGAPCPMPVEHGAPIMYPDQAATTVAPDSIGT